MTSSYTIFIAVVSILVLVFQVACFYKRDK